MCSGPQFEGCRCQGENHCAASAQKSNLRHARRPSGILGGRPDFSLHFPIKSACQRLPQTLCDLFLAEPPTEVAPLADYRTIPNTPVESPEFAALKRRIFQLHRELCAIAKEEQTEALPFVNSCNMEDGVPAVVDAIRRTLGIEPVEAHTHC